MVLLPKHQAIREIQPVVMELATVELEVMEEVMVEIQEEVEETMAVVGVETERSHRHN